MLEPLILGVGVLFAVTGFGTLSAPSLAPSLGGGTIGSAGLPRELARVLRRAGYRNTDEGWRVMSSILLIALAGGMFGSIVGRRFGASGLEPLLMATMGVGVGAGIPISWLRGRAASRTRLLRADFGFMLELLCLGLGGGQSLAASWSTVTRTIRSSMPAMGAEMSVVEFEIEIGRSWSEALDAASARTGCDDFRQLGRTLEHAERFGSDIATVISAHADSTRHETRQRTEERAHRQSVQMLFPMILCLLPATLVVLIGPLVIMLLNDLAGVSPD